MNRTLMFVAALGAGISMPMMCAAQAAAPAGAPAPAAGAPMSPPQAVPAKIALVAFEQAVYATNEGMKAAADVQKKYEPQKTKITGEGAEVDSLKKQLDSAPATLSDAERAERLRVIDTKEKQYNLDVQDASAAFNSELQTALSKVAQKVQTVMYDYLEKNGYTVALDVSSQSSNVIWARSEPNADITKAVIDAYNAQSGVGSPASAAPAAARKPAAAAPRTAPKPAAK